MLLWNISQCTVRLKTSYFTKSIYNIINNIKYCIYNTSIYTAYHRHTENTVVHIYTIYDIIF